MKADEIVWKREEALVFVAMLSEVARSAGYSIGLTGSVLTRGWSMKDLDVIVFPHGRLSEGEQGPALSALYKALKNFGMSCRETVDQVHKRWRAKGNLDEKHVEVWSAPMAFRLARVDLFVMNGRS